MRFNRPIATMEPVMPETSRFVAPDFLALTIGVVVFFVGVLITQRVAFLRSYNIPEPVTGGFVAALAFWTVHAVFGLTIDFEMTTRDRLLVIFFATVGINARLADLGRVLGILCLITVAFVFLQDAVGVVGAVALGLPPSAGVVMGYSIPGRGTRDRHRLGSDNCRGPRLSRRTRDWHRRRDARPHHRKPAGRADLEAPDRAPRPRARPGGRAGGRAATRVGRGAD
jgi:Sodium/glutamate symporter